MPKSISHQDFENGKVFAVNISKEDVPISIVVLNQAMFMAVRLTQEMVTDK